LEPERTRTTPARAVRAWTVAALLCSAAAFYFGTGLAPVAALTWVAPLPVLLLAPRAGTGTALGTAFLAYFLGTANSWAFFTHSGDEPVWPVGTLICVGGALLFLLCVWAYRRLLVRGRPLLAAATAPALWTAGLFATATANPIGIMGTLATTQTDLPVVLQTASVTGWYGVEFLVLFLPAALAAASAPGVRRAARLRTGGAAVLVLALVLGGGAWALSRAGAPAHTQRVAMIAHNHAGWGEAVGTARGRALLAAYAEEIERLPRGTDAAVLPEGAFAPRSAREVDAVLRPMARAAHRRHLDVVVAFNRLAGDAKFNTAVALPGDGGRAAPYLKHHDTVSRLGHRPAFVPGSGGRIGLEICADANFPQPTRSYAESGARLLLVPASDNGENGEQHSRTGLLRAVENGVSVAVSDRDGTSMAVDGTGHVLAKARTQGRAAFTTLTADVPDGPGATPYSRYGDWFPWLCAVLGLAGAAASWLPGRGRTAAGRQHGPGGAPTAPTPAAAVGVDQSVQRRAASG